MRPEIRVVIEEDDSLERLKRLRQLADPKTGVIVLEITPGTPSNEWLVRDLLAALGKEEGRHGDFKSTNLAWERAAAWVIGEDVREIVAAKADLLGAGHWRRLTEFALHVGCSLTLVSHGPGFTRLQRAFTLDWPVTIVDFTDYIAMNRPSVAAAVAAEPPAPAFPEVPDIDFPKFRAAARERLTPSDFARVDAELCEAAVRTAAWFIDHPQASEREIRDWVQSLVRQSALYHQIITRLRGAQIAAWHHGTLIKVKNAQLATLASSERPAVDEQLVSALRAYANTTYAVVPLIASLASVSAEGLASLAVQDLTEEGISIDGVTIDVPRVAHGLVRSHLAMRASQGCRPDSPLFTAPQSRTSSPALRWLRLVLKKVTDETGYIFADARVISDAVHQAHWLRRRGVLIQEIS